MWHGRILLGPRRARRGEWMFAFALVSAVVGLSLGNVKFYPLPRRTSSSPGLITTAGNRDPAGASLPLHCIAGRFLYRAGRQLQSHALQHGAVKLPATETSWRSRTPRRVAALVQQGLRTRPICLTWSCHNESSGPSTSRASARSATTNGASAVARRRDDLGVWTGCSDIPRTIYWVRSARTVDCASWRATRTCACGAAV